MNLFGLAVDALFVNRILPAEVRTPSLPLEGRAGRAPPAGAADLCAAAGVRGGVAAGRGARAEALRRLGEEVYAGHDPAERLSREEALRFYVEQDRHMMALRVSGVSGGAPSWKSTATKLTVRLGTTRRTACPCPSTWRRCARPGPRCAGITSWWPLKSPRGAGAPPPARRRLAPHNQGRQPRVIRGCPPPCPPPTRPRGTLPGRTAPRP